MKNKNRNINFYTQGQRVAARVLFMVVLLGNCGLGNVLAAPKGKEVTAVSVSEAKPGSLWERLASRLWSPRQQETHRTPAGPVAEGVTEGAINAIVDRNALNPGELDDLLEATKDNDRNVRKAAFEAIDNFFWFLNTEERNQTLQALIALTNALDITEFIREDTVRFFTKLERIRGEKKLTSDEKELIISALDKVESTTWAGIHASEVLSKLRPS